MNARLAMIGLLASLGQIILFFSGNVVLLYDLRALLAMQVGSSLKKKNFH